MFSSRKRLLAAYLILICLLPAWSGLAAGEAKQSVVIAMEPTSEPEAGFDPAYGWGAGEHVHEPLIQSTLTVTTAGLEIGFDLATHMSVSEDGLTWTVTIREDALFSDGERLTASDVAFTYNAVKAESSVNDFTMLRRAEAMDDFTIRFEMETPYAIWPYTMSTVGIVPEHAYGPGYGERPIGSGRYMLVQWDKGQQVILEANPLYYGGAPAMQRVTIVFMSEDAAFAAVQAGQVDIAYTSALYGDLKVSGYQLAAYATVDNRGINLPTIAFDGEKGNDVTCDPAVRRAINLGLDRQRLIDAVLSGYGAPAYSVCDGMPWFHEASIVSFDPGEAGRILDEAGWAPGADHIRSREGVRASLTLLYPAGDSIRQALAAETANQLTALGIEASYEGVGWDVAYERAQRDPLVWGWGAHTPMEMYNLYHTAPGTGLAVYSPYANPAVDAYMEEALRSTDLEASYALWRMAQWDGETGIAADIPWVWLVNIDHLYWLRDGLAVAPQKIHPHGHGFSLINNVDQWSWE